MNYPFNYNITLICVTDYILTMCKLLHLTQLCIFSKIELRVFLFESPLPKNLKKALWNSQIPNFGISQILKWDWLLHNTIITLVLKTSCRPDLLITCYCWCTNTCNPAQINCLLFLWVSWNLIHFWRSPCISVTESSQLQQSEISCLKQIG